MRSSILSRLSSKEPRIDENRNRAIMKRNCRSDIGREEIPADAVRVSHADLDVRVIIDFGARIDRVPLNERAANGVEIAVIPQLA